eukprot:scaffold116408_cov23-Cyclotella_meneghiniana.AAC.1
MRGSSSSALLAAAILLQTHRSVAFLSLTNNNVRIHAISRSVSSSSRLIPTVMMSASSSLFEEESWTASPKSSSCDYSFALDYAIRIYAPILVASSQSYENDLDDAYGSNHGVCYSSTWEFHLLEQRNSDNLDAAVMQYNTCNNTPSNTITCTWENDQNQWYLEIIESKQTQYDDFESDSSLLPKELT